ncbi:OpgC family protein [Roseovarius rhodophyticola]|uniref:OpgC domain-containing protein n=1 Tax=Roseovarius rhodophyticola TaxID=3080827 RepID=A0ABZ2TIB0_9RHOB|nr:OpgC domain-containing protein [Roseovarius sp. W115]MDV2929661.1 OpgC domain-containing protein [Roseovarius sp. W115]
MATISPSSDYGPTTARTEAPALPKATVRDPRLDFFRGIAMFIILLAHTPGNLWTRWIPARWGFSDATEMFVFCSGMASAIAFGKLFQTQGLGMGSARIAFRTWQVYWAHIGLFIITTATLLALPHLGFELRDYTGQLNLKPFLNNIEGNLVGLMTLTYVPNYFDILPMYMVILLMIPVVMALAKIHPYVALGACLVLWGFANMEIGELFTDEDITPLQLPAQYWFAEGQNTRPWFFNPFGWQLCFFTGFALMIGWIPRPPVNKWLVGLALAFVLFSFVFSAVGVRSFSWQSEWWDDNIRSWQRQTFRDMAPLRGKTDFGIFRYLHMLSLGYLAWALVGEGGKYLKVGRVWNWLVKNIIMKVGQQSLAVFVFSMLLARLLGVWLDETSTLVNDRFVRDPWINTFVNLVGFALLVLCAYVAGWFKSSPWKPKRGAGGQA